jgi:hypothetical protein
LREYPLSTLDGAPLISTAQSSPGPPIPRQIKKLGLELSTPVGQRSGDLPCGFPTQRGNVSARSRFTVYTLRGSGLRAALLPVKNHRGLSVIERDSAMGRVSMPSRASAIFVATAATLGAMTAYNMYRAWKAEREHPPTGRFVTVDGVRLLFTF